MSVLLQRRFSVICMQETSSPTGTVSYTHLKLKHADAESVTEDDFQYNQARLYDALTASTDDYIFIGNMKTGVFRYPPAMAAEFALPGEVVENAAACWSGLIHPHDEAHFLESNQEIADGRAEEHDICLLYTSSQSLLYSRYPSRFVVV